MYYTPGTDNYDKLPVTYIPVYSTSLNRTSSEHSGYNYNDIDKVQRELAELREEVHDLRQVKSSCRICSPAPTRSTRMYSPVTTRSSRCDNDCSICYPRARSRHREENYSRSSSPAHYCSICNDYVIDQEFPPASTSLSYRRDIKKRREIEDEDKLSEYLSRQLDVQRLHPRYIPEERPIWIPTAYKQDYPHRRWATRSAHFSEP